MILFHNSGAVTDDISVFRRNNGDLTATFSNSSFVPLYFDEQDNQTKIDAANKCGGLKNIACVFDFIATQDEAFALATKNELTQFAEDKKKLGEFEIG